MRDAPLISRMVIELEDGRWVSLTKEDIAAARNFVRFAPGEIWPLFQFLAELSPPPMTDDAEVVRKAEDKTE